MNRIISIARLRVAQMSCAALVRAFALSVLCAGCLGCGSDLGSDDAVGVEGGPLYLIMARTFSSEITTGILTPTSSLESELDYSRAIEQAGGGVLYSEPGIGTFMIGSGEEPTITRYRIDPDNRFIAGQKLSFAGYGVQYLYADTVIFVNLHKAYYVDLDQLQAIAFDPSAMAITGSVSLAGAAREGFFTSFGEAVRRDDAIYFPAEWYTEPDWDRVPQGSMLVRLDPETDEITFTEDARCTGMLLSTTTDAGDTYWFSDGYNTLARRGYGPEHGVPDCALRLRAGERAFDPDWQLDVGSRTGGAPAIPVLRAGGSKVWLRVLDESAIELPVPTDYSTLDTAPAWQWHLLDVESDASAQRNDERPLSSVGAFGIYVDGRAFTTVENSDYSESTLVELTPEGFVTRSTLRGVVDSIARVR